MTTIIGFNTGNYAVLVADKAASKNIFGVKHLVGINEEKIYTLPGVIVTGCGGKNFLEFAKRYSLENGGLNLETFMTAEGIPNGLEGSTLILATSQQEHISLKLVKFDMQEEFLLLENELFLAFPYSRCPVGAEYWCEELKDHLHNHRFAPGDSPHAIFTLILFYAFRIFFASHECNPITSSLCIDIAVIDRSGNLFEAKGIQSSSEITDAKSIASLLIDSLDVKLK